MHSLPVDLNIRGKKGLFHQEFVVMTSAGKVALIVEVDIEDPVRRPMSQEERLRNKQSAMEDARAILKGNVLRVMPCPPKVNTGRHSMMLPAASVTILRNGTRQYRISKIKSKSRAANTGTIGLSTARKVPSCQVSVNRREGL